ncbi:dTDP-4-amino-4,6-dideoxy-D-galactose acyltransferase [Shimwellia pseudoproteus]|uniref:dTDP-4-amino-4,6-dideoxy-D-galactose acyltransferase n=1 Tax=Shimwellia pseudoproteus TaxID=570012 RepID=UPI0018EC37FD|nr:dTDP-4-amino-4,6-dideoxy-D-galactose acyltransferase [Shimwellia pseudoproteus]
MPVHANIEPLEWESRFFGIESGILRFDDQARPLEKALLESWPRVQAKIDTGRSDQLDALQRIGFQLVEGEMDFCIPVSPPREAGPAAILATAQDIEPLRQRAAAAFTQSRFRAPWYGEQDSGRFYAQWIENAVLGTFDDCCLMLADPQGGWRGFVTLRQLNNRQARIGLLAGPGAGAELMQVALRWCAERKLARLYVATQISNSAAIRRYIRSGGDVVGSAYWLYR